MKSFCYTIRNPVGIHLRPAGMLSGLAGKFECDITVVKDGKSESAKRLIMLTALGVRCADTVTVIADGADEDAAFEALRKFFNENL